MSGRLLIVDDRTVAALTILEALVDAWACIHGGSRDRISSFRSPSTFNTWVQYIKGVVRSG